jgi:hypothetical protein
MKALVNGRPENVHHNGKNMVIVIDDNVEGGLRVVYTRDVVQMVNARLVKKRRRRMTKHEKLFSSSPVSIS